MARKKNKGDDDNIIELFTQSDEIKTIKNLQERQQSYRVYSTGSLFLDCALGKKDPIHGNGGIQARSVVECCGPPATLKTALSDQLAKSVLLDDPTNYVVALYSEESDVSRLDGIGFTDEMKSRMLTLYIDPDEEVKTQVAERQLDKIRTLIRDPRVKLVIIDSIKALCSVHQLFDSKGNMRDSEKTEKMAARAVMVGEFVRDFTMYNKEAILFMTNQISDSIQTGFSFPINPQFNVRTPGGYAKDYYCNIRMKSQVRPIYTQTEHPLTGKKLLLGWEVSYNIFKNKLINQSGNRVANSKFYYDPAGFDLASDILFAAQYLELPEVKKGGAGWWEVCGERVRSEEGAIEFLKSNKEAAKQLERIIVSRSRELFDDHTKIKSSSRDELEE